jgi:hypothetical protein
MPTVVIAMGSVVDAKTLKLDEALPVNAGKVRITVEMLDMPQNLPFAEFMANLRRRQQERGHVPPTREMVDARARAERDSWIL